MMVCAAMSVEVELDVIATSLYQSFGSGLQELNLANV
jgi:hypothetical protein